ncbi:MAG: rRNA maturation RNase YbeY [Saprospiraceae bacterium]
MIKLESGDSIEFHFQVDEFQLDIDRIKSWIRETISLEGIELANLNVVFCSDDQLLEMNIQHLNHDYYTDILSFPFQYKPIIGDLFISVDRVTENAQTFKVEFIEELRRVIIHGVLHLLGHNDVEEEEELQMRKLEDEALSRY